eukprot:gene12024-13652_t
MSSIDRTTTTPTLVRCFWRKGSHNSVTEYRQIAAGVCPSNEVAIYVWKDSTLREIFDLVEGSIPCGPAATLDFRMIFIDKSNHLQMKNMGEMTKNGNDEGRPLHSFRYQTGDFIDIAVMEKSSSRRR